MHNDTVKSVLPMVGAAPRCPASPSLGWTPWSAGRCAGARTIAGKPSPFRSCAAWVLDIYESHVTPECYHGLQVDLPEPEDEGGPKRRGGAKGGSVLAQRGEDKQLLELAGRRMQHAER